MNKSLKARIVLKYGTQYDFAKVVGVLPGHVSEVIRGRRHISLDRKLKWAKTLECEVRDIFSYTVHQ